MCPMWAMWAPHVIHMAGPHVTHMQVLAGNVVLRNAGAFSASSQPTTVSFQASGATPGGPHRGHRGHRGRRGRRGR